MCERSAVRVCLFRHIKHIECLMNTLNSILHMLCLKMKQKINSAYIEQTPTCAASRVVFLRARKKNMN